MTDQDTNRQLVFHGMVLFLLGLLTGFVIPLVDNPRAGVSAHLEGVMNGTFLIALGYAWTKVKMGPRALVAAYWLALYRTYANWVSIFLGAAWGTSSMTPVAGAGFEGTALQEGIVNAGLISLSVAIIAACVILTWGLRGGAQMESEA